MPPPPPSPPIANIISTFFGMRTNFVIGINAERRILNVVRCTTCRIAPNTSTHTNTHTCLRHSGQVACGMRRKKENGVHTRTGAGPRTRILHQNGKFIQFVCLGVRSRVCVCATNGRYLSPKLFPTVEQTTEANAPHHHLRSFKIGGFFFFHFAIAEIVKLHPLLLVPVLLQSSLNRSHHGPHSPPRETVPEPERIERIAMTAAKTTIHVLRCVEWLMCALSRFIFNAVSHNAVNTDSLHSIY